MDTQPKHKILLVDDDPTLIEALESKFVGEGHEFKSVRGGAEALAVAEDMQPDIIILDLMMINMPGEVALQALKNNEKLQHIPVLVFTNKGIKEEMDDLLKLGAAKCLIKSDTSLQKLGEVVEELVASK